MRTLLFHPVTSAVVRLGLGGILLLASFHKIVEPPDFAKVIFNYKLVPASLINLAAIYLPWVELVAGLFLAGEAAVVVVTHFWARRTALPVGGALVAGMFACMFICALGFNLARGCPTICGCFDTFEAGKSLTDAEKFAAMRREIIVDVGLLVLAAHVCISARFWRGRQGPDSLTDSARQAPRQ